MARNFDGVDDYIDWGAPGFAFAGDLTYSAYVRYDTLAAGAYANALTSCGGAGVNYAFAFSIDSDQTLRLYWQYGGGALVDVVSTVPAPTGSGGLNAGGWSHVAFTRNAATKVVKFYVGGAQVGADVSYPENPDNTAGARLVTGADATEPSLYCFDGALAEEGLWTEALGASLIASMSNAMFPKRPGGAPGGFVPDRYHPLRAERADLEANVGLVYTTETGVVHGAAPFAHPGPLYAHVTEPRVGRSTVYAAAARSERGRSRDGYLSFARAEPGGHRHTTAYRLAGGGAARGYAAFARAEKGGHRIGYTPYGGQARGAHTSLSARLSTARGAHRVEFGSYTAGLRGAHAVLSGYRVGGRGAHATLGAFGRGERGGHRVANAALERYELYLGVDFVPNLESAPWQTFASLPFTTPALAAGHTYRFVLRKRNAWGLVSQNIVETAVVVAGDGTQSSPPSAPANAAAAAAAGGTVLVTADYAYDADGAAQADTFLVYTRTDGTSPNPATDTPAEVDMVKGDGVAKLEHSTAALSEGTVVKALVRTRRSGTPDVDSTNTTPAVQTTATLLGPAAVAPSAALLGRLLEQAQTT